MYSAYDDELLRSCHLPAPGRNRMNVRLGLKHSVDVSHVSSKNNKINLLF